MKRHTRTLISFAFFTLLGGGLVLVGPRLAQGWMPATALAPVAGSPGPAIAEVAGRFSQSHAPELAVARQSDAPPSAPGIESHWLDFGGKARQWWSYDGSHGGSAAPVVLLLHGSERRGRDMMQPWQEIAQREGLVLIAPDAANSKGWSRAKDGNDFLNGVLAEARDLYPINPGRVFLFGHSAGANFALALAAAPPEGVQAIAVHAGAVSPAATPASPLPLRLYIGDEDRYFPLETVRASALALAAAGHPTDLVVIPGHDHWFYDAAPGIAANSWDWFASK